MNSIRIGIADDHRLFREGIRMIMSGMKGMSIALEAASGKELIEQLKTVPVDVVLLDIEMKDMNGVETLKALSAMNPKPKVIILSMHTEARMMSYMMELGASGYLPKDVKPEELEEAIRTAHEKGVYLNEAVSMSLLSGLKNSHKYLPAIELSPREKEILELICLEFTAKEIGEKLFISERTVEGHRKNLCTKLEAKNTAGLVKKALQLNLVGH
jgi:two-component system, NarL family, response regulator DegU